MTNWRSVCAGAHMMYREHIMKSRTVTPLTVAETRSVAKWETAALARLHGFL